MEPYIPTSFIPKKPIDTAVAPSSSSGKKSFGLVSLVSTLFILATVGAYGVSLFYEKTLETQKQSIEAQLAEARDGIGTDFVSDMKALDRRITGVKKLLESHIVVTPIFQALEATTLHSIQYRTFQYEYDRSATSERADVKVMLKGSAKSYATLALQSDALVGNSLIKNPVFSGLSIDEKNKVNFDLTFSVPAERLSYESFVASLSPALAPGSESAGSLPLGIPN